MLMPLLTDSCMFQSRCQDLLPTPSMVQRDGLQNYRYLLGSKYNCLLCSLSNKGNRKLNQKSLGS